MNITTPESSERVIRSNTYNYISTKTIQTPIGSIVTCISDDGICLFQYEDSPLLEKQLNRVKNFAAPVNSNQHLYELERQIDEYFNSRRKKFELKLFLHGTSFQKKVWASLTNIPYGTTVSYKQQANAICSPKSSRAVGTANGQNPIVIINPCHRVIASNGGLSGYSGGLLRKKYLLEHEGCFQ